MEDYYHSNQYCHFPSDYHPADLHPSHLPRDFHPSYYSPYFSFPSYGHFPPRFTTSSYVSGFGDLSESILIDPASNSTRFVVSYSNSPDFNEPIFEEYDPTPYAGGYDPSATYGVALAPSDEICYPRSTKGGVIPGVQVPLGEADKATKDNRGGQEAEAARDEVEPAPVNLPPPLGNANTITDDGPKERESASGAEESGYGSLGDDSGDWESSKHIPYQPSPVIPGCGLDAMDICDGIFGYWPCLEREVNRRINCGMGNNHYHRCHHHERGYWPGGKSSQDWQIRAADYLFGSSNPYDDDDDHTRYGGPASFRHQANVNPSLYPGSWL